MPSKRIVFVVPRLAAAAEHDLLDLAGQLAAAGACVTLATWHDDCLPPVDRSITRIEWPGDSNPGPARRLLACARLVRAASGCDLLVSGGTATTDILVERTARILRRRGAAPVTCAFVLAPARAAGRDGRVLGRVDLVLAPARHVLDELHEHFGLVNTALLEMPGHLARIREVVATAAPATSPQPFFAVVGRWEDEDGDVVLSAFLEYRRDAIENCGLLFLGGLGDGEQLITAAHEYPGLRLSGTTSGVEPWSDLSRAVALLAPRAQGAHTRTVEEALSLGLPVIAHLAPDDRFRLAPFVYEVPPNDPGALAVRMREVASDRRTAVQRAKSALAALHDDEGRTCAERFLQLVRGA